MQLLRLDSCHIHSLSEMLLLDHPWNTSAGNQNQKRELNRFVL